MLLSRTCPYCGQRFMSDRPDNLSAHLLRACNEDLDRELADHMRSCYSNPKAIAERETQECEEKEHARWRENYQREELKDLQRRLIIAEAKEKKFMADIARYVMERLALNREIEQKFSTIDQWYETAKVKEKKEFHSTVLRTIFFLVTSGVGVVLDWKFVLAPSAFLAFIFGVDVLIRPFSTKLTISMKEAVSLQVVFGEEVFEEAEKRLNFKVRRTELETNARFNEECRKFLESVDWESGEFWGELGKIDPKYPSV